MNSGAAAQTGRQTMYEICALMARTKKTKKPRAARKPPIKVGRIVWSGGIGWCRVVGRYENGYSGYWELEGVDREGNLRRSWAHRDVIRTDIDQNEKIRPPIYLMDEK
jgi:hypothetical protein